MFHPFSFSQCNMKWKKNKRQKQNSLKTHKSYFTKSDAVNILLLTIINIITFYHYYCISCHQLYHLTNWTLLMLLALKQAENLLTVTWNFAQNSVLPCKLKKHKKEKWKEDKKQMSCSVFFLINSHFSVCFFYSSSSFLFLHLFLIFFYLTLHHQIGRNKYSPNRVTFIYSVLSSSLLCFIIAFYFVSFCHLHLTLRNFQCSLGYTS